eukprot:CAMPEP_0206414714 /NCGR_PEP_ID=MMETSP0294-20121207/35571_1 /ASSEMBLY_ACC=CAM_ASM_000327 /TAXON_ID=39354 /ORGANISM="Heterosigma akashiwo, Strain CCMP2393" /LENGTH=72 /DNA_ID=CAMNT_0053876741 /DNA_START=18 /DNA_END=232 /DNA_ORIENTATION=+
MALYCGYGEGDTTLEEANAEFGIETYCYDPVWSWSDSEWDDPYYSYDCYLNATTGVYVNATSSWRYDPANFT